MGERERYGEADLVSISALFLLHGGNRCGKIDAGGGRPRTSLRAAFPAQRCAQVYCPHPSDCLGNSQELEQDEETVSTVWDAAIILARYLANPVVFPPGYFRGRRVLELGSGCSLPGIVAWLLGAHTILTDLGAVLPVTQRAAAAARLQVCMCFCACMRLGTCACACTWVRVRVHVRAHLF